MCRQQKDLFEPEAHQPCLLTGRLWLKSTAAIHDGQVAG